MSLLLNNFPNTKMYTTNVNNVFLVWTHIFSILFTTLLEIIIKNVYLLNCPQLFSGLNAVFTFYTHHIVTILLTSATVFVNSIRCRYLLPRIGSYMKENNI